MPVTLGTAGVNVVNAAIGNPAITVAFSDTIVPYHTNVAPIAYGSSVEYGVSAGKPPLTILSSADTTTPFFQQQMDLKAGGVYSLFVMASGSSKQQSDVLLTQDTIPFYTDSLSGVRFVDLSFDAPNINVNIKGNYPSTNEVTGLSYKQITSFKSYPLTKTIKSYIFEIRNQSTGALLKSFTWKMSIYRCNTIVIAGSVNPANGAPLSAFQINNY